MVDYIIDDNWILNRVSNQSNSFKSWLSELKQTVTSAKEEISEGVKQLKQISDNNSTPSAPNKPPITYDNLSKLITSKEDDPSKKKEVEKALSEVSEKYGSQIKAAESTVAKTMKTIQSLTGVNILSGATANIGAIIGKTAQGFFQQSLKSGLDNVKTEINLDFLSGKQKSLASALYDVAVEKGIKNEGILYLIKSLPDFESFLYSTSVKKYYRDHTEHQLRVAALGDFLLEQDLSQGKLLNIVSEITEIDSHELKDKIWWVIGLIHDIGYPLEKMTTAVNWSLVNQILKCYPGLDLSLSPLEFSLYTKSKKQQEYLDIIEETLSKEARTLIRLGAGHTFESFPQPSPQHFKSTPHGHQEFTFKSDIRLDHGVIGALSLLSSLGSPEEIRENRDDLAGYILAARAIALHNLKDLLPDFTFEQNPLSFVLTLMDELQEWGRPIPYQIRDSYFNTSLEKITLLDHIKLTIDESQWLMEYKNQTAKQLSEFNFKRFCRGKEAGLLRLTRKNLFPKTYLSLKDISMVEGDKEKIKDEHLIQI